MDLKFSFGGASPDHDHGGAPSGIPLPFDVAPVSSSSELELVVRRDAAADGERIVAEAISGDGVTYARAEVPAAGDDAPALARAARSGMSRAVAELEGPLAEAITAVVLDLGGSGSDVARELGMDPAVPVITEALQRRIGVGAGTKVRLGA
ncbi:hypothetical protein JD292_10335 [Leucobacter sp. CSA2]|uniref:Uncharacterized protein n=1 Tax=Leucobacter edaphi TaxID=2796472 RepID=A0A934QDG8_9MICO|nr:hypothetical protein [Leucobacter edaphi]MBK0422468.1 hypothetical protein [Leucobacter edaphi]